MLSELFGQLSHQDRLKISDNRQGLAAEFTAGIGNSWIEPFIDTDSRQLYRRLEPVRYGVPDQSRTRYRHLEL